MTLQDLKPCPFCGSTQLRLMESHTRRVGIDYKNFKMRVQNVTSFVRCEVCHAHGGAADGIIIDGHIPKGLPLPDWAANLLALEDKAVDNWNRRMEQAC